MILQQDNIFTLPILHYKMEFAAKVYRVFHELKPDCVAVELPERFSDLFLRAANRLPDISIVACDPLYYLCEPCDGAFEGLKCASDMQVDAFCIDQEVQNYPDFLEPFPDTYSLLHIDFHTYYENCRKYPKEKHALDFKRELYMAKRLKELSLQYEKVLFICGFHHAEDTLHHTQRNSFPLESTPATHPFFLCTLTEESTRNCLAEYGWISKSYAECHQLLDRQKMALTLYQEVGILSSQLPTLMKFARNLSFLRGALTPSLYEIVTAAKGCIDDDTAYRVWQKGSEYPYRKNDDDLPELDLPVEKLWGNAKQIKFKFKEKRRKEILEKEFHYAPSPYTLCSYPKEDILIESFARNLKQKVFQKNLNSHSLPLVSSLEDGIDVQETVRKWVEKKIYVKMPKKEHPNCNSIVIIFDEDLTDLYPWKMTWIGEHEQESDMAFYATDLRQNIVGPGISRCEYGGLMMTSPPQRLFDIWQDVDYDVCTTKAEILLTAAIDYSHEATIVYIAKKPPSSKMKLFAARFGKKISYLPLGTSMQLNRIRYFHVLDGHDKRKIADEYI